MCVCGVCGVCGVVQVVVVLQQVFTLIQSLLSRWLSDSEVVEVCVPGVLRDVRGPRDRWA